MIFPGINVHKSSLNLLLIFPYFDGVVTPDFRLSTDTCGHFWKFSTVIFSNRFFWVPIKIMTFQILFIFRAQIEVTTPLNLFHLDNLINHDPGYLERLRNSSQSFAIASQIMKMTKLTKRSNFEFLKFSRPNVVFPG